MTRRSRKIKLHPHTVLVHDGRDPEGHAGTINPPIHRGSTICFPTVAQYEEARQNRMTQISYGLHGSLVSHSLENTIAKLEGGYRSIVTSSGMAAIATAILSFVQAGDHLLMVDSAYGPTRTFCAHFLKRFGVSVTYYDPLMDPNKLAEQIQINTKLIYAESPGSNTFEMQDIPALATIAHTRGLVLLLDNTWGTPLHFPSFQHGVDVSIHAATKYICGHSDVLMGIIVTNQRTYETVLRMHMIQGYYIGPDDCALALRGLRTMAVRMEKQLESALKIAKWLQKRPEVKKVLFPALLGDPGHAIWKRDFTGGASLFSILLQPAPKHALTAMLDSMALFAMGASWGGYESLILWQHPEDSRTAVPWTTSCPLLRLHIGLEDPMDLIDDLEAGLQRRQTTMDSTTNSLEQQIN